MVNGINESIISSIPLLSPLVENVRAVILSLQWLMGGLFGLYLILIYLRWREYKMVGKLLKEIRDDIKELKKRVKKL